VKSRLTPKHGKPGTMLATSTNRAAPLPGLMCIAGLPATLKARGIGKWANLPSASRSTAGHKRLCHNPLLSRRHILNMENKIMQYPVEMAARLAARMQPGPESAPPAGHVCRILEFPPELAKKPDPYRASLEREGYTLVMVEDISRIRQYPCLAVYWMPTEGPRWIYHDTCTPDKAATIQPGKHRIPRKSALHLIGMRPRWIRCYRPDLITE
jgi:hypothetical protein